MGQTSLKDLSLSEGFLLAAPNGSGNTWNTYPWQPGGPDDLGWLASLMDHLIESEAADPARIFVTGMSAGAGMAFALAWEHGDRLAAIAPVANNLGEDQARQPLQLKRPLPVLHIMGDADPSVPYGGGKVFGIWEVKSATETAAFWAGHNRCSAKPTVEDLPDIDKTDASHVKRHTYRGAHPVVHLQVVGGGHTWPNGPKSRLGDALLGPTNRDLDAGQVIWEFFRDKRRPLRTR